MQAKRLTKTSKIDSYLGQVARLSDQELLEELRALGESPGPVTDTTRAVYQRQLARHMADKAKGATLCIVASSNFARVCVCVCW